jgi:uncharacterized protein YecE (DUF72 family)
MDEMWRRFRLALEPLRHAGKLGAVLFQFPPWFYYRRSNLAHIAHCAQFLEGYQIAVEFRNRTWFDDKHRSEVLAFERENALAHVVVDEPQGFSSSIPSVWEVSSPNLAIFRLHGRNAETWDKKGLVASSERFDYEYREQELREFIHQCAGWRNKPVASMWYSTTTSGIRASGAPDCSPSCSGL